MVVNKSEMVESSTRTRVPTKWFEYKLLHDKGCVVCDSLCVCDQCKRFWSPYYYERYFFL